MQTLTTIDEARKLRDSIKARTSTKSLEEYRKVRDCRMDDVLASLKDALPEELQAVFGGGYQTGEVEEEITKRKHILASNPLELEIIARSKDTRVIRLANDLEHAGAAVLDALFPASTQLRECDGLLGDPRVIIALDKLPAAPDLAKYKDRPALEAYAESTPENEDENTPEARYRRAFESNERNHQKAYAEVCDECEAEAGLRYRVRIIDLATWGDHRDGDDVRGIAIGMEYGRLPVAPVLQALSNFGLKRVGENLILTQNDQPTEEHALGVPVMPLVATEDEGQTSEMIEYTQLRDREYTYILLEHPKIIDGQNQGACLIVSKNFYGPRSTGYYMIAAIEKLRGNDEDAFLPPVIGLIREAYELNINGSVWRAMSLEEGTRDVYAANTAQPAVPPLERTQRPANTTARRGQPQAIAGELKRTETTGIKLMERADWIDRALQRYRSDDFFSGSGTAGEPALHLARLQTAFLTTMQPLQTKRAEVRKAILEDVLYDTKNSKRTIFVPWFPDGERDGEDIRVAEPMKITPEMAGAPILIRTTIGAESPETKAAREAASRAEVEAGFRAPETHMQVTGVKDIPAEMKKIAKGGLLRDAIVGSDGQPGWSTTMFRKAVEARVQQYVDARFPPPPKPQPVDPLTGLPIDTSDPMAPPVDPNALPPPEPLLRTTQPPAGHARFNPPVNSASPAPGAFPGVA